jgi:hypothetical protein
VLGVFALAVLGWLVFGARAVRLEDQADAVLDQARAGPISDAEATRAQERLDQAGKLSPDIGPMLKWGQLLEARGNQVQAAFVAHAAAIEEPENLQAWFLVWIADPDKEEKAVAKRRLLELNPWFSEVLRRAALSR